MALNVLTLQGSWNQVKGKIRDRWGELTDDELQSAKGSVEQLIGLIQRKTGETRSAVEDYLNAATASGASAVGAGAEVVKDYFNTAAETMRDTAQDAMESVRVGYEETEEMVRRRPMESLAVCFGAGLIAGVVVTLLMRSK